MGKLPLVACLVVKVQRGALVLICIFISGRGEGGDWYSNMWVQFQLIGVHETNMLGLRPALTFTHLNIFGLSLFCANGRFHYGPVGPQCQRHISC